MKSFVLCLTLAFAASCANAQSLPQPLPLTTDLEDFASRYGVVIQREFTRIGDFANLRVDVVKESDLLAKNSMHGVRISGNVGQGATRETAFIDADEMDGLLKAIDVLRTSAFSTTPENFTDIVYRTRGGLAIGAVYANRRWTAYLTLDRSDPRTSIGVEASDIDSLRGLLAKARDGMK